MNPNLSRVSDKIHHFEQETLRVYHDLVETGHYNRALEVLRSGQETIALYKRILLLSRAKLLQALSDPILRDQKEEYENR